MSQAPSLIQSIAILAAVPAGMIFHELSHYLIAWLAGCRPRFEAAVVSSMAVAYDAPERAGVDTLIRLAPLWVGALVAVVVVGVVGWPALSWWWLAGSLCWLFATVRESGEDARDVFGEPADWEADLIRGQGAMLVAALVMLSPYGTIGAVLIGVAIPTFMAGAVLTVLGKRGKPGSEMHPPPAFERSQRGQQ